MTVQRIWLGGVPITPIFGIAVLGHGFTCFIAAIAALEALRLLLIGIQRAGIWVVPRLRKLLFVLERARGLTPVARAADGDLVEVRGVMHVIEPVAAPYGGGPVGAYAVVEEQLPPDEPDALVRTTEIGIAAMRVGSHVIHLAGPCLLLDTPASVGMSLIRNGDHVVARGRIRRLEADGTHAITYRTHARCFELGPNGHRPLLVANTDPRSRSERAVQRRCNG